MKINQSNGLNNDNIYGIFSLIARGYFIATAANEKKDSRMCNMERKANEAKPLRFSIDSILESSQSHIEELSFTADETLQQSTCSTDSGITMLSPEEEKQKEKPLKCPECGKTFGRNWLLAGHMRTHTGERPFRCDVCPRRFADNSNLRAHKQTHNPVKSFECSNCHRRFALKSYLSKHKESACGKYIRQQSRNDGDLQTHTN